MNLAKIFHIFHLHTFSHLCCVSIAQNEIPNCFFKKSQALMCFTVSQYYSQGVGCLMFTRMFSRFVMEHDTRRSFRALTKSHDIMIKISSQLVRWLIFFIYSNSDFSTLSTTHCVFHNRICNSICCRFTPNDVDESSSTFDFIFWISMSSL